MHRGYDRNCSHQNGSRVVHRYQRSVGDGVRNWHGHERSVFDRDHRTRVTYEGRVTDSCGHDGYGRGYDYRSDYWSSVYDRRDVSGLGRRRRNE